MFDPSKAIAELERRLASHQTLGDALRTMFHEDGYGLMFLYRAVSHVQNIPTREAMRLVIHETESWGGQRGAAANRKIDPRLK